MIQINFDFLAGNAIRALPFVGCFPDKVTILDYLWLYDILYLTFIVFSLYKLHNTSILIDNY